MRRMGHNFLKVAFPVMSAFSLASPELAHSASLPTFHGGAYAGCQIPDVTPSSPPYPKTKSQPPTLVWKVDKVNYITHNNGMAISESLNMTVPVMASLNSTGTAYVYTALNPAPPVIFLIHGGGMFTGQATNAQTVSPLNLPSYKVTTNEDAAYWASLGFATAEVDFTNSATGNADGSNTPAPPSSTYYFSNVSNGNSGYKLAGQAPAGIQDIRCAIRWVRHNASKYYSNAETMATFGGSGGGGLAAAIGAIPNNTPIANNPASLSFYDSPDCLASTAAGDYLTEAANVQLVIDLFGNNLYSNSVSAAYTSSDIGQPGDAYLASLNLQYGNDWLYQSTQSSKTVGDMMAYLWGSIYGDYSLVPFSKVSAGTSGAPFLGLGGVANSIFNFSGYPVAFQNSRGISQGFSISGSNFPTMSSLATYPNAGNYALDYNAFTYPFSTSGSNSLSLQYGSLTQSSADVMSLPNTYKILNVNPWMVMPEGIIEKNLYPTGFSATATANSSYAASLPEFFIMNGERDWCVPTMQSWGFAQMLLNAGVKVSGTTGIAPACPPDNSGKRGAVNSCPVTSSATLANGSALKNVAPVALPTTHPAPLSPVIGIQHGFDVWQFTTAKYGKLIDSNGDFTYANPAQPPSSSNQPVQYRGRSVDLANANAGSCNMIRRAQCKLQGSSPQGCN